MKYGDELIFLLFIYAVCRWQANRFDKQQKKIRHWFWFLVFSAIITGAWYFLSGKDYYFAGALALEHLVFFNPILNYYRTPHRAFFYIHSDPKTGSWLDGILLKLGNAWPYLWAVSLAGLITLQFFI